MSTDSQVTMSAIYLSILRKLVPRLQGADILWALTGSLSLALQGIALEVHDIDIQTDKNSAYDIARLFPEYLTTPVSFSSTDVIRSHFGQLVMDGIKIEIMGDVQKRLPNGSWQAPPNLNDIRFFIDIEALKIPVLPLEYEHQAYLLLNRHQKAKMLRDWLNAHLSDVARL